MANLEMIELYPSPWSERLRWVLAAKRLSYTRRAYQPLADEEELRRTTGLSTAPVLIADGEVIGDSDAAVEWLERRHPTPALMPDDPQLRAQIRAWELAATETLAPAARLGFIGRVKALGVQPLADHFAAKYGWSEAAERHGERLLRPFVTDLARAVERAPYLVGGGFTRADLTVASMVATVIGHPAEELFSLDPAMRTMFGTPLGDDPGLAPLRRWRDELYRRHRGGPVRPPAAGDESH
jgi:glutathione S-transferase